MHVFYLQQFFPYLLPFSLTVHVSEYDFVCLFILHMFPAAMRVVAIIVFVFFFVQVQGIKGYSLALSLSHHDIVKGTCLDYMHGFLLGVVKTLLSLWFFPSKYNKKADYFIGDKVTM